MDRLILHCDMNNCYASIEQKINPELKGKAIAVCGNKEDRHGIVLAKSEIAKKRGVKTADTIWQAKQKCPNLIIVSPHYDLYLKYSKMAQEIYYKYTDQIEPYGLDECWLDVTGSQKLFKNKNIAYLIKEDIKENLGITISVGASFNKIFAKLGSDMKKPDAVTEITKENFKQKVWHLNANEMLGVGRATYKKLLKYNIVTIGDLANTKLEFLVEQLGKNGKQLWLYANGLDTSRVMNKEYKPIIKSVSHGITCSKDLINNEEVYRIFLQLSQNVAKRLKDNDLFASGVQITVRDSNLNFKQFQTKFQNKNRCAAYLAKIAQNLFEQNYNWQRNVRALTIAAINLGYEDELVQFDVFDDYLKLEKQQKAEAAMFEIQKKFGKNALNIASLMLNDKYPDNKFERAIMPSQMYK